MMKLLKNSNTNLQCFSLALVMLFSMGQALAFFKSCEMNSSDHSVHQTQQADNVKSELNTDNESMEHDGMSKSQGMNGDCCDSHCICPQGSCSSVNLISVISSNQLLDIVSGFEFLTANSLNLSKISNSLYRPPISC